MNSKRAMAQLLKHLTGLGVTHLPKVELPVRRSGAEAVSGTADRGSGVASVLEGLPERPEKRVWVQPVFAARRSRRRVRVPRPDCSLCGG